MPSRNTDWLAILVTAIITAVMSYHYYVAYYRL